MGSLFEILIYCRQFVCYLIHFFCLLFAIDQEFLKWFLNFGAFFSMLLMYLLLDPSGLFTKDHLLA